MQIEMLMESIYNLLLLEKTISFSSFNPLQIHVVR